MPDQTRAGWLRPCFLGMVQQAQETWSQPQVVQMSLISCLVKCYDMWGWGWSGGYSFYGVFNNGLLAKFTLSVSSVWRGPLSRPTVSKNQGTGALGPRSHCIPISWAHSFSVASQHLLRDLQRHSASMGLEGSRHCFLLRFGPKSISLCFIPTHH